nr:manganese efflux pump [Treponema socranskii]
MSFIEAVLLGVALSMDSFAVSVTNGMQLDKVTLPYTLAVSLMFGAFQALMPLIGFFCGSFFYAYIEAVDHWIVLALLCALGGKMIFEAVRKWHASYEFKKKPYTDGICRCRCSLYKGWQPVWMRLPSVSGLP